MASIQRGVIKQGKRNGFSRHLHSKNDKDKIAAWRLDLNRIVHVFNVCTTTSIRPWLTLYPQTELAMNTHVTVSNTHTMVSDIHRTIVQGQEGSESKKPSVSETLSDHHRMIAHYSTDSSQVSNSRYPWTLCPTFDCSTPGESPPLPPRTFFGRDELVKKIVGLAEDFVPIALIGAGGIGKTSIALTVLHHDRIKQRFGDNRRFIRCDQFPPSHDHLLSRLSDVIGAGIENPKDLTPLRAFLSSKEMLIVFDNAESILDPQGMDAREIYTVVDELSRFDNICICITSRISTIPPDCKHLNVPTLSIDAARDTFYRIYDSDDRPKAVNDILEQLAFHPLSITLLATVAQQNKWDVNRLAREWDRRRTSVLQTQHNTSLAATIELSLASPLFQTLGLDARALLEVVAFFPQGIDESNIDWLFPTISNRTDIFDKFCVLSLTYRSNGFITMLAPLRDHLSPKDPKSSSLLCRTKENYFSRISVDVDPDKPNFGDTRWIMSEDVNVEHLLDVFTTIDANSDSAWRACSYFIQHLVWHKRRPTILKSKIEKLPDTHSSKPGCLFELSRLLHLIGNRAERKRLLTSALVLQKGRGNDPEVAQILRHLSDSSRLMGLPKEGIEQAKEALAILERLGDTVEQAQCLIDLARLLRSDDQSDAAVEAATHAINLLPEKGEQFLVCESHRILGDIYQSNGEREKAIHHFDIVIGIASSFDWHDHLFCVHYSLAVLFRDEGKLDDAHTHVEHAKSHGVDNTYYLGYAMELQAGIWNKQRRFKEARSQALRAAEIYEKVGATKDLEDCRKLLQEIEKELDTPAVPG